MSVWDELSERFHNVVTAVQPSRWREQEPETPDPEADLAANLGPWTEEGPCGEHFLPWLEDRIEMLDLEEANAVRSHPDLLLTKGRRMEAKFLRDQFLKWRGTSRTRPPL